MQATPLDPNKESLPNTPNLKHWNYDTSTNVNYTYKSDTMDPIQRPTRVNFNKQDYMMPQWEKLWSEPSKPINMPPTEYCDKYIRPEMMSHVIKTPKPTSCFKLKPAIRKEIVAMQTPKTSEHSLIRLLDPYVSTQKLSFVNLNPVITQQLNSKMSKHKQVLPEYESFYTEPIFNRQNTIRLLPTTKKNVPYNAHKTETSASYKIPINTLINLEDTVGMPISVSPNPTLAQIFSIPGMYTTEYSKISG
ncbi:uncharacterized protein LOC126842716 isoform X2 [Adelges cooleyi]|uniref:uncharacterized protein LOC126842716 isoform X2 n=1 Tax=Adelges cooleyi TaxID=133065 RepID=UPI002180601A|nr:uncharacterized protein LOC126842716 isoform X2 [Adelges cooleyi]